MNNVLLRDDRKGLQHLAIDRQLRPGGALIPGDDSRTCAGHCDFSYHVTVRPNRSYFSRTSPCWLSRSTSQVSAGPCAPSTLMAQAARPVVSEPLLRLERAPRTIVWCFVGLFVPHIYLIGQVLRHDPRVAKYPWATITTPFSGSYGLPVRSSPRDRRREASDASLSWFRRPTSSARSSRRDPRCDSSSFRLRS